MRQQLVLSLNKSLFEKTDFVVADQTEYTFNVDETAAEMLHSEISPDRLFWNVYQTFIFHSVITRQ